MASCGGSPNRMNSIWTITRDSPIYTMGNWGSAEGSDGFFGDNAGPAPTDNALFLLNQAAGLNTAISVTADGNATAVLQGGTLQFSAKVMVSMIIFTPVHRRFCDSLAKCTPVGGV